MARKPEPRRYPIFKDFENNAPAGGRDLMLLVVVVAFMRVSMTMAMMLSSPLRSQALAIFTARPRQAIGIASAK